MQEENIARSAMEGVTMGIRFGLEGMKQEGIKPRDIRLTGGGSKSETWRQIAADVFNAPTVTMEIEEAASFGAALQAMWCAARAEGQDIPISRITDSFVRTRAESTREPVSTNVGTYDQLFKLQNKVSESLRSAFQEHRRIISGM
jgi:xylulokinase